MPGLIEATRGVVDWSGGPTVVAGDANADGTAIDIWVTDRETGAQIEVLGPEAGNGGTISEKLNQWPIAQIAPHFKAETTLAMQLVETEVQIYEGGKHRFTGVPLQQRTPSSSVRDATTLLGVGWYVSRRLYGGAPWTRQWLLNSGFEDGMARWNPTDAEIDDTHVRSGDHAVLVTGSVWQPVYVDLPVGFGALVEVWAWIPAGVTVGRGLEVNVPGTGVGIGDTFKSAPITAATPRETWTALRVTLDVIETEGVVCEVHVFGGVDGAIWADDATFTVNRAEGANIVAPTPGAIVPADLIRRSVQGLNIGFRQIGGQGFVPVDINRNVDEMFSSAAGVEGGADFDVVCTPLTRTFTTWLPRRGRDIDEEEVHLWYREDYDPEVDGEPTILSYDPSIDATKASTRFFEVGEQGTYGIATDPDGYGGLILDDSESAPSGTAFEQLEPRAWAKLRAQLGNVKLIGLVVNRADYIDVVLLGDRVQVDIDHYSRQFHGAHRVVARDWAFKSKRMLLTVVPEPVDA